MQDAFIPFARPSISDAEINEVVECMRSGWVTTGPRVARFEKEFAAFVGARHALAVNSATAGLHLALSATQAGPGDLVITSPFTFTASAEIVRYLGADVVFADIDPVTLNISPQQVEERLRSADAPVRAIIPVHFAGLACDMRALQQLAEKYSVKLIEDAAHAIPATYAGRMIGGFGFATVFSFYATKTICTGEGGMVVTDDDAAAQWIKLMRLHGINRDAWDRYTTKGAAWHYDVVAPGYKYNMTDMAAAMGIHQLAQAEAFRRRREAIAERYFGGLADLPLQLPPRAPGEDLHAWHLFVIQLQTERLTINRQQFIDLMTAAGIGTGVHFIPLHLQTYWRERYQLRPEDFPVAKHAYERVVSLPIYPGMSDTEVGRVVDAVRGILGRCVR